MGDEQLQWRPDGTRISALVPMIGAPDAARASIMSAGIGSLGEQDEAGSQHGACIRRRPARNENDIEAVAAPSADAVDAIIVGTLSPGVGEDQAAALRENFPDKPVILLTRWHGAANPARPAHRESGNMARRSMQSSTAAIL